MKLKEVKNIFYKMGVSATSLEQKIKYRFKDKNLMKQALTHKSFAGRNPKMQDNEKLEFLGDAVFDLCVTEILMEKYPDATEGDLSKIRASIVNTEDLADIALDYKLDKEIKLSHNEDKGGGRYKPRLLACTMEAVVGAIYIDGGFKAAQKVVRACVAEKLKDGSVYKDYKSQFQEWTQKQFNKNPIYQLVEVKGPDHNKLFIMDVYIEKEKVGTGTGRNKKKATQAAALSALKKKGIFQRSKGGKNTQNTV